jgi:hypothetical protein
MSTISNSTLTTRNGLLRHTKQALATIEPKYIICLRVGDFGFATRTPFEIMDFITVNYGRVTPAELASNRRLLDSPF